MSPWTCPNDPSGHERRFRGDEDTAGGIRRSVVERSGLGEALSVLDHHRRDYLRAAYLARW